ncbi:Fe-S cluster assembly protein SufD [Pleomorphovibrio marinus]|uniref:Fe-S cluster assembly protein SufD n=1 Tax=Pleomorphovibrio marinus TaxID=2164132 RepID=UPI000E0AFB2D|nr:Fe-S cluster assembly protein SufD [Pleomorphovibrio marinus]
MSAVTKKEISVSSSFMDTYFGHKPTGPFASLRENAAKELAQKGLPSTKDEEYKFTPITKKIESSITNFGHAMPTNVTISDLKTHFIPGVDTYTLVFNNGILDKELSGDLPDGVSARPLSSLSEEELTEKIALAENKETDPYATLNQLAFQDGLFLEIRDKAILDKPILLLHLIKADNHGQTIHPRLIIETGKFVEATFIQLVASLDEQITFLNGLENVKVGEGSHIHHLKIQDEGKQALEVSNMVVDVPKDATFTSFVLSLQGQMIRNNLTLNLLDSNCEGNMFGIYLTNGQTHVDNHTNVDHTKPHSESNELYKGILTDKSRGVFNGKIFVRQDAQKTNAFQQNNNILLSEDAIINTKPQLEIWADDVKCSHGCTTGQLDEEALFYLRTRGISKENAKALLLYAFAGEVLEKINHETFREYCVQLVQQRLGGQNG